MANRERGVVTPYRKPINLNIGLIIFSIIFIYIIIGVFMFFTSKHVIGYEVKTGALSESNIYTGIALREELTVSVNGAGYINYFAREGEHVAVGDLVYTLDETGSLLDYLEESSENASFSDKDYSEIRSEITNFQHSFKSVEFKQLYDFQYRIKGTALKLSNFNMLQNMDGTISGNTVAVNFCKSTIPGVVIYNLDGYENLTQETIHKDMFEQKNYKKNDLLGNELVAMGDAAYKLVTSEYWSVIIPIDSKRAKELIEEKYVQVKFLDKQYYSWAAVTSFEKDKDTYLKLDFNNSMIAFADKRFLELEIISNQKKGLKIPNSAIIEKEFYLIPKDYVVKGGMKSRDGVMRETYKEDGSKSTSFVETTIYSETETDYYVDGDMFEIGDQIVKPNSTQQYAISRKGTLVGVYNINKGYADFKEITVLYSNNEYSIVKSNTIYGLSVYDHIVLDAESVKADDFIYE